MPMKIDTRCRSCGHEFPEGELRMNTEEGAAKGNWGCPKCKSPLIEKITENKPPFKWGGISPKFEEGEGH